MVPVVTLNGEAVVRTEQKSETGEGTGRWSVR